MSVVILCNFAMWQDVIALIYSMLYICLALLTYSRRISHICVILCCSFIALMNLPTFVIKLVGCDSCCQPASVIQWLISYCVIFAVLEGEMYQLSHLLTDQKTIMTSMMELSVTGNKGMQRLSGIIS